MSTQSKPTQIPIQEDGQRLTVQLQAKDVAIEKLIREKRIVKLEKCKSNQFVTPALNTAEKDGTVKSAIASKPKKNPNFQKQISQCHFA